MSESIADGEERERPPAAAQSGVQVWVACALLIVVPVLLILVVKYFLAG